MQDPQATKIIIDPGLSFGTGEHPKTKLRLLILKELIKGGEHILDCGTATGVLSIAALKVGAALSIGLDIDHQAVASAQENMLLNDIDSNKMHVYYVPTSGEPSCFSGSIDKSEENNNLELKSSKGAFDIVAANILQNPLLELVEDIVGCAKNWWDSFCFKDIVFQRSKKLTPGTWTIYQYPKWMDGPVYREQEKCRISILSPTVKAD